MVKTVDCAGMSVQRGFEIPAPFVEAQRLKRAIEASLGEIS